MHQLKPSPSSPMWWACLPLLAVLLLNACSSSKPPPPTPSPTPPTAQPEPIPTVPDTPAHPTAKAKDVQAFRLEMARHIYERHAGRVHAGRLPPLLKGVGVVEITIDDRGQIARMEWVRAPKHAPEVIKAIEGLIEEASPFPAPTFAKQATFMETWLWNRNDRFQLDSLTAGQD